MFACDFRGDMRHSMRQHLEDLKCHDRHLQSKMILLLSICTYK